MPAGNKQNKSRNQIPKGWRIIITRRRGHLVLYCAKPPGEVVCPSGYQTYSNRNQVPKGWQVITRQSGRTVLYCAKPSGGVICPSGYQTYSNRNQVPKGWQVIIRKSGRVVLYCAKPKPAICPRGWSKAEPIQAAILAAQGYQIKTVGNIICARKPSPKCEIGRAHV